MLKLKLLRYCSIGLATAGIGLGVASASSASIGTTGPSSNNQATFTDNNNLSIDNHNLVSNCLGDQEEFLIITEFPSCGNDQNSMSGSANNSGNTNGGGAGSGSAGNSNSATFSVQINNGSGGSWWNGFGSDSASINTTGPSSTNLVQISHNMSVDINNTNDVFVNQSSDQNSSSGSANVSGNTNGGSSGSGSASNSNTSSASVNINN